MIFTQIYATIILPGVLAWTSLWLGQHLGLDDLPVLGLAFTIFLGAMCLGYEAELFYFREVCRGTRKLPRLFAFVLLLPAIYALSFLVALAIYYFFPELPLPALVVPSTCTLALGLWLLLRDHHHRGRRLLTE